MTREQIEDIIERTEHSTKASVYYDWFMVGVIIVSILPLMFMQTYTAFKVTEIIATVIFVADYILRWITADIRLKKGKKSFWLYPFTFMAVIDLLSILPAISIFNPAFRLLRFIRLLRIIRVMKLAWYSKPIATFAKILYKERHILMSVLIISLAYIFVTALVLFNVEPHVNPNTGEQTFNSFFDALYWATVTLTTVGYGDMCPVTDIGRFVSMLSSLFGVAIIALPSGVITASYLDELREEKKQ